MMGGGGGGVVAIGGSITVHPLLCGAACALQCLWEWRRGGGRGGVRVDGAPGFTAIVIPSPATAPGAITDVLSLHGQLQKVLRLVAGGQALLIEQQALHVHLRHGHAARQGPHCDAVCYSLPRKTIFFNFHVRTTPPGGVLLLTVRPHNPPSF